MFLYIVKRLLLMIPTLLGILLLTFAVIQFVPGGPVEQMVAQLQGRDSGGEGAAASGAGYRGRQAWLQSVLKKSNNSMALTSPPTSGFGRCWASSHVLIWVKAFSIPKTSGNW